MYDSEASCMSQIVLITVYKFDFHYNIKNMNIVKVHIRILFLLILIFTTKNNNAQNVFQKDYTGSGTSIGYSVQTDNSGFTIAGTTSFSGQGGKDVLLMRTDLNGNLLWAETIGGKGDDIARALKKTSDGGYILVGSTSSYVDASSDSSNFYIIKTDVSGNVEWTRAIGSFKTEVANDVIETYDHQYAIVGYTESIGPGNEDIYFIELDANGNLQWAYGMGSSGSDFGNSLVQIPSHGFILAGSTTGFGAGGQIPYLLFTDESGNVQNPSFTFNLNTTVTTNKRYFTKIIEGYFNDYVITGSDGLDWIDAAQHFILDIGQNGEVNWMKKYFLNSGEGVGTSLDKTSDGGFIIGGTMGFDHPALIKIDAIGQLEKTKFYPDISSPYFGKGLDVKQAFNGEYILAGYRYNSSDTSLYLIKADLNLASGCDEHDGFINTAENMNPTSDLQITTSSTGSNYIAIDSGVVAPAYPYMNVICISTGITHAHPLIENLEIRQTDISIEFLLNDADDFIISIAIYNLLGEKVRSTGKNNQDVFITGLPRGLYFYRVMTNKQLFYTGKFTLD